ncbi:MAG: hypothetical protein GY874_16460 [Desulfobacteraceae bacterium]|nr:hypothetical protein [Desulfobacteraceae bacterium]
MKNNSSTITPKQTKQKELMDLRRRILTLPPEKALEIIADCPMPVSLIQSFAEEDLNLLIHTIGPEDAVPILALASNEQWEYLLDMEVWARDRMDLASITEWLLRLLKADPDRITHWIMGEKLSELEHYLNRNIDVFVREYEQDPSEIGPDFHTEDQIHYFRLKEYPEPTENQKQYIEKRDSLVFDLLKRLAVLDHQKYISLLISASSILPAETEEELYRLRNVRLSEKGFLPCEEAVGVYQELTPEDLFARKRKSKDPVGGRPLESFPFLLDVQQLPEDASLFLRTLASFHDPGLLQQFQTEFAGLCNQVISADQLKIKEKSQLNNVVKKVGNYISIGLEKMISVSESQDPYAAANLIQNHLLIDIFRVGYGCTLALKWKADQWVKTSWFSKNGLALSFWGETGLGVIGGLMLKKPLFYNNFASGSLYREFVSLNDIVQSKKVLKDLMAFDDLLDLIDPELPSSPNAGRLTHENVLLTLWASYHLGTAQTPKQLKPISMGSFRSFFKELWDLSAPEPRVSDTMKELFLGWLSDRSGMKTITITGRMATALEHLFNKIENELGDVSPENLGHRYINLFLLKK